jgi:hypothetical protein
MLRARISKTDQLLLIDTNTCYLSINIARQWWIVLFYGKKKKKRVSMEVLTGADAVFFYIQYCFIHMHIL